MSLRSLLLLAAAIMASTPATADSLAEAIASAYEQNPSLAAQRALVRQFDEGVPQALAPARPTLGATATGDQGGINALKDNGRTYSVGAQLSQSLYRGGRTRLGVSAAENRILAARARLRATENQIVLATITAYADVIRYASVVDLNISQVKVLDRELQQSKDRFDVGDLTRTDVAQSQARLATAKSNLVVAQNQYAAARQAYLRVVGRLPDNLAPLPPLPPLPGTENQAVDVATANNPELLAARFDEAAARYDVQVLERGRLPTLTAQARANYSRYDNYSGTNGFAFNGSFFTQDAILSATIPIYQAGLIGSQVRQSQAIRSQLLETISVVDRSTHESVVNSFNQLRAARAVIEASQVAVDANALAAEGVKQENQVGTRTIIELLNAEQEKLTAQVNLVTAQREEQVAGYALLASVGAAEAIALGVQVNAYDATINARRVRGKWGDAGDQDAPALPRPDAERASHSLVIGPQQP